MRPAKARGGGGRLLRVSGGGVGQDRGSRGVRAGRCQDRRHATGHQVEPGPAQDAPEGHAARSDAVPMFVQLVRQIAQGGDHRLAREVVAGWRLGPEGGSRTNAWWDLQDLEEPDLRVRLERQISRWQSARSARVREANAVAAIRTACVLGLTRRRDTRSE